MEKGFLKGDMLIKHNDIQYIHWVPCIILLILLLICWFSKKIKLEGLHPLVLAQENIRNVYAYDNPNIQHLVNPVKKMIDRLGGTKWYPQDYPRRVNSIMDPMTEEKLHEDLIFNKGNMFLA